MDNLALTSVVLCDLDGVVWLAHRPIPGSVEAVDRLRRNAVRVLFVTNNSFSRRAEQEAALERIGIPAEDEVVTSAMSAASVIQPNWRVLVCGGSGLHEEVSKVAAETVVAHHDPAVGGEFDAVVVGMHREFNYEVLACALRAVKGGAALIGSNSDSTYPTPDGLLPGGGSILAAIEHASGVDALVTGKPHEPMATLVRGLVNETEPGQMLMVGDRSDTDGAFASTIGCPFALVLSGVTGSAVASANCLVEHDLAAVADRILSARAT